MNEHRAQLQRQADDSATWRGHRLGPWQTYPSTTIAHACCENDGCGAYVSVDTRPPANGIDIGGEAVALNCPVEDNAR